VPYPEEEEMVSFAGPGHDLLTRESEMMLDEVLTDYSNLTTRGGRVLESHRRGRLCTITTGHDGS